MGTNLNFMTLMTSSMTDLKSAGPSLILVKIWLDSMEVQWLLCVAKESSSKTIPTSLAYNNYAHNVYSMPNLKRAYLSHTLADFKNLNTKILLFGPGFQIFTLNPTFVKLKNRAEVPSSGDTNTSSQNALRFQASQKE